MTLSLLLFLISFLCFVVGFFGLGDFDAVKAVALGGVVLIFAIVAER